MCCLTKAIYGLKQAPRSWYSTFKQALAGFGFINSKSDSFLFLFHDGSTIVYCLVYVNDLILIGNSSFLLQASLINLTRNFKSKTWGPCIFFLGVEVIPIAYGLFLTQYKYIRDLFGKTSMDSARDVTTPLSTSVSLQLTNGSSSVDSTKVCKVIGAFQYVSFTHPDISFAVNKLL